MDIVLVIRTVFKGVITYRVSLVERIGKTVVSLINVRINFMEMFAINVRNYLIAHHNDIKILVAYDNIIVYVLGNVFLKNFPLMV